MMKMRKVLSNNEMGLKSLIARNMRGNGYIDEINAHIGGGRRLHKEAAG